MEIIIHIGGHKKINAKDVILLTSDQNYTRIFLENGKQLYVATTLKTLEKRFKATGSFFRVNRSNMLNMSFASECTHQDITINNKQTFRVSRRRQMDFIHFQHIFNQN